MKKIILVVTFVLSTILSYCQWYVQNSNTTQDLLDVYFIDSFSGWAVGDNGTLLKTEDGGQQWLVKDSLYGTLLSSIYFITDEIGYVVGYTKYYPGTPIIKKTTDGGDNWFSQNAGINEGLPGSVYFINEDTGFIVGSGVQKTIDGGQNWIHQWTDPLAALTSVYFVTPDIGYAVGYSNDLDDPIPRIFKTSDAGNNWMSQNLNLGDLWRGGLYSVFFFR